MSQRNYLQYVYTMPDKLEEFLPALATVYTYRGYYAERNAGSTEHPPIVFFLRIKNPVLRKLVKPEIDVHVIGPNLQEADFEHEFSATRAFSLGGDIGKHMTQSMGIMIGVEVDNIFPPLNIVEIPFHDDLVLISDPGREAFWYKLIQLIRDDAPDVRVSLISTEDTESNLKLVQGARVIVGDRCGLTYFACCMGKRVFEIYHSDEPRGWLSKWSNKQYIMIYGEPDPDLVIRGMNTYKYKQTLQYGSVDLTKEIVPQ